VVHEFACVIVQLNVDFCAPKDYKEPSTGSEATSSSTGTTRKASPEETATGDESCGVWGEGKTRAGKFPRRRKSLKSLSGGTALGGGQAVSGKKRKLGGGLILPMKRSKVHNRKRKAPIARAPPPHGPPRPA